MKGTPEADLENLQKLVLEQQALLAVMDARFRGLRHFILGICQILNIKDLEEGRPLEEVLRRVTDEELDARLAQISDDDPKHAARLRKFIEAAKSRPK